MILQTGAQIIRYKPWTLAPPPKQQRVHWFFLLQQGGFNKDGQSVMNPSEFLQSCRSKLSKTCWSPTHETPKAIPKPSLSTVQGLGPV